MGKCAARNSGYGDPREDIIVGKLDGTGFSLRTLSQINARGTVQAFCGTPILFPFFTKSGLGKAVQPALKTEDPP